MEKTTPAQVDNNPLNLPAIRRDAEGLRDALFDELNLIRAGKVDTRHARAVSQLAKQIIESARLELAHHLFLKGANKESLQLGSKSNG